MKIPDDIKKSVQKDLKNIQRDRNEGKPDFYYPMKISGLTTRVKPKDEVWYLRIKEQEVWNVKTITKRERIILSSIRKLLLAYGYNDVDLTNRQKYVKQVHVAQNKLLKMKANNYFENKELSK
jgi:hypothetical protein